MLCSAAYFDLEGRDFAYRQPYPIKRYLCVASWQEAKAQSAALLKEFQIQLEEDQREP